MSDQLATLLDDAENSLTDLEETLEGVDTLDDLADDELEAVLDNVTLLADLADEVEDVLDAIDLTDLPEVIDVSALLEAIEVGEIPDALADGDADDVVRLRNLIRAINLQELWDAANVRELWEAKRDLEDTVDEGEEADSLVGEAVDSVTDDDEDDELIDTDGEMLEGDVEMGVGGEDGFGLDSEETEPYETMIQHQAMEGIDEFRDALILTHGKFEKLYEFNREKMRRQDTSTNSRNPTAASTVPVERNDLGHAGRHSTVPKQVRHSSAPGFDRVYGPRFERELEKRRSESGGGDDE
ncbi:hypothetical protein [Natrononativus amylolyticus]|uniref:hypothetical protein n=1 Tax=Natrononativus amylolyticus TaxID=2963434 RepID=UPI0020CC5383|nr:hypothetical protein [Natrononativus amylolyticus]